MTGGWACSRCGFTQLGRIYASCPRCPKEPPLIGTAPQLLGHNLRRLLEERGLTEATFALAIGIPGPSWVAAQNVRPYLTDDPTWPKPDRLDAMARVLGVPVSELFRDAE